MDRMWLPMVVHSAPLITPMFLTERIVKNRSLSALSFQFLFILDLDLDLDLDRLLLS